VKEILKMLQGMKEGARPQKTPLPTCAIACVFYISFRAVRNQ
jgi:hypothetical protein